MSKKEREICEFEMDLTNFFVRRGAGGGESLYVFATVV